MRIDRRLRLVGEFSHREVRAAIAARRVSCNGLIVERGDLETGPFIELSVDGKSVYKQQAVYIMLHKPKGYVSANRDREHPTLFDLLGGEYTGKDLHIAGRLDRFTTGLVLLTNDGQWSRTITAPESKKPKVYEVELNGDLKPEMVQRFTEGFYFPTEDITTSPSELVILSDRKARLTLYEGKYHQVKRMFHRVGLRVVSLHRLSVGPYQLGDLAEGEWRRFQLVE